MLMPLLSWPSLKEVVAEPDAGKFLEAMVKEIHDHP